MRHRVAGRKLGRTTAHRQAMLRNLSTALFDKERITTTLAKAKELRPYAEKLVTLSKRETLHARRQLLRRIRDKKVVAKMVDSISARFAQRPGGYTRIIKLGPRRGDNAEMAIVELVEAEAVASEDTKTTRKKKSKKSRATSKKTTKRGAGRKSTAAKRDTKAGKKTAKKKTARKSGSASASSKTTKKSRTGSGRTKAASKTEK